MTTTEAIAAVRQGTMTAEQAAAAALAENAYSILHMEYADPELKATLTWNNGMAQGPNAAEYYARRGTYAAIQDAARKLDAERIPAAAKAPEMVKCACGHTVARASVMTTSRGTSCPECYDRMSE